jgi:hypothetical protein
MNHISVLFIPISFKQQGFLTYQQYFIAGRASQKKTFKEEYLEILEENNVEFDQEYLFEFFSDIYL